MYSVTVVNKDKEVEVHSPYPDEFKLEKGIIQNELNEISTFEFMVMPDLVLEAEYISLATKVKVYNTKTQTYDFVGRVLDPEDSFANAEGFITKSFYAESELAYLKDSLQDYKQYKGKLIDVIPDLLDIHNGLVDSYQQFELGVVDDLSDLVVDFWTTAEMSTWEVIREEIVQVYGIYIDYTNSDGNLKLNFYKKYGYDSEVDIELEVNLLSLAKESKASEIITRLIPLGDRIIRDDIKDNDVPQDRLNISSVNNGIRYIDDLALQDQFKVKKVGFEIFEGVTSQSELYNKGVDWLNNQRENLVLNHYSIEALDLFLINLSPESYLLGNYHRVYNYLMGIDEKLQIVANSIDIVIPSDSTMSIGDKWLSLEEYQREALMEKRRSYKFDEKWFRQNEINKIEMAEMEEVNRIQAEEIEKLEGVTTTLSDTITVQQDMLIAQQDILDDQNDMLDHLNSLTTELGQDVEGYGVKGRLTTLEGFRSSTTSQIWGSGGLRDRIAWLEQQI